MLPATQGRSVDKDLVNEMSQKGHLRKTRGKDYKLLDILLLLLPKISVLNSKHSKRDQAKTIWFLRDVSEHFLVVFGSQNIEPFKTF